MLSVLAIGVMIAAGQISSAYGGSHSHRPIKYRWKRICGYYNGVTRACKYVPLIPIDQAAQQLIFR